MYQEEYNAYTIILTLTSIFFLNTMIYAPKPSSRRYEIVLIKYLFSIFTSVP